MKILICNREEMRQFIENTMLDNVLFSNTIMSFDMINHMRGKKE